jgi:hypothetical protein
MNSAPPPPLPNVGDEPRRGSSSASVLGALLVVLGLLFLAGQYLNFDIGRYGWPVYIIGPGLALIFLGLTQRHGSGLTIAGSVVTITGLVLLYQTLTDHWESWAYAWALVGPGGSGVGMLLYGTRAGNAGMARAGFMQVVLALALFAGGFVFFEGILGISGRRYPLPSWLMPVLVIALGLLLLVRGFTARQDAHRGESDEPTWPTGEHTEHAREDPEQPSTRDA